MTLYALLIFAALNQATKTGTNVAVLLTALSLHASPLVVGVLSALSSLLPMLFAVSIGRLNDRFGARLPMFAGASLVIVSSVLPALWPGLPTLFLTTTLTGLGAMAFAVSCQNVVGLFGNADDRTRNFAWMSISFSAGGIIGPMLSGSIIDFAGYTSTFVVLAFLPVSAMASVGSGRLRLPPPRHAGATGGTVKESEPRGRRRALDLLRDRRMRIVYLLTALHVSAWEVFSFLVPVYGSGIGLSASSIGIILGTFASATFLVRVLMPVISGRYPALALIRASLVLAGVLFIFFPLVSSVPILAGLAFVLGLGLGITQPLAMAVLYEAAPPGRTGEAVGLRTATVHLSATTTPLIYGALGTAVGMLPVFWGIAVAVWAAVWALS